MVFVGYGASAPETGWNGYAGLDVTGTTGGSRRRIRRRTVVFLPVTLEESGSPATRRAPAHERSACTSSGANQFARGPKPLRRSRSSAGSSRRERTICGARSR